MEFEVRGASLKDAGPIAVLTRALGYPCDSRTVRKRLRRILGREDQRVFVAELSGGKISGWLQAHCSDSLESGLRVEIVGLIVSGEVRRRGIGRGLVAQVEAWASKISAEAVIVRSNTARVVSHAFYPSLGYFRAKTQAVYRKLPKT